MTKKPNFISGSTSDDLNEPAEFSVTKPPFSSWISENWAVIDKRAFQWPRILAERRNLTLSRALLTLESPGIQHWALTCPRLHNVSPLVWWPTRFFEASCLKCTSTDLTFKGAQLEQQTKQTCGRILQTGHSRRTEWKECREKRTHVLIWLGQYVLDLPKFERKLLILKGSALLNLRCNSLVRMHNNTGIISVSANICLKWAAQDRCIYSGIAECATLLILELHHYISTGPIIRRSWVWAPVILH